MVNGKITLIGRPGDFVHVPRHSAHAFRNAGDTPARMLIINTPGGTHERLFEEAGDAVSEAGVFPPVAPPDMPRLMVAAARDGIEFLNPGKA